MGRIVCLYLYLERVILASFEITVFTLSFVVPPL